MMKKVTKVVGNAMWLAGIAFLLWMAVSWVDVCIHNTTPDGEAHSWNAIRLLVEYGEEVHE